MKKNKSVNNLNSNRELMLLALPSVIFIFIICYIPLYGLILPFKDYKFNLGFLKSPFIGFDNFKFLFNSNVLFEITRNTILYNLSFIIVGTCISVSLALMLFELQRKFVKVYQTAMFFPYFMSWVVVSYIGLSILDMDHGVMNKVLVAFGADPVLWYNDPKYWPFIIFITAVWKGMGYGAIIYYAGLMGIDSELFEAAYLDGATKLQRVWYISIPMLKQLIVIMTILNVGRIFYSDFGLFYNVPLDSAMVRETTEVIDTYVYRSLKQLGDIGMASAAGLYQSIVGFLCVVLSNLAVRKFSKENALF